MGLLQNTAQEYYNDELLHGNYQFVSLSDIDGTKLQKVTVAIRQAKKDGIEPWGLTKAGKDELEEIAARKAAEKNPSKGDTTLFMGELEQGLDENAE